MSQKNKKTKVSKKPVVAKTLAGSRKAVKKPFELVSYSVKAVIPVGAYANIQPEITIRAESIEQAERVVMPFIEALFTKYRSDGTIVSTVTTAPAKPVVAQPAQPQTPVKPQPTAQAKPEAPKAPVATQEAPIVLTVPFNRAKGAVESCTSQEALKNITDQIEKSVKLTDGEKQALSVVVADKKKALDGSK